MTAYIVMLGTGDSGDFSWGALCYCPDEATSQRALALLQADYDVALSKWRAAVRAGNPYVGDNPLALQVVLTSVQTVPTYYGSLYDGFSLIVEEVPSWEEEL